MSTPPISANAWCRGGTSHAPLAADAAQDRRRALVGRGRRRRLAPLHGRRGRRLAGHRQVDRDRDQVGVRLRGVRRLEPLVELLEVEPALAGGLAQQLGHLVAVGVGDAQLRRVARPVTGVLAGLQRSCHAAQPSRREGLSRSRGHAPGPSLPSSRGARPRAARHGRPRGEGCCRSTPAGRGRGTSPPERRTAGWYGSANGDLLHIPGTSEQAGVRVHPGGRR